MRLTRRQLLDAAAGAALLPISSPALAQSYPIRPVRIVVAAPAGGANDILCRLIGQRLSERLGQAFIIENRPGGNNNVGTEAVVRAPPDGYTLLAISTINVSNGVLFDKLSYNFARDIVPVAGLMRSFANIMVVNSQAPSASVAEFIALAKANPGKINFASGGIGTTVHLSGELFKMMAGVEMVHVPYRGETLALNDLLGGQVHVMFTAPIVSIEHIKAGRLRALAVTATTRWHAMPDVPTLSEFLPGYEVRSWFGIGAPKNTPADVVEILNEAINGALGDSAVRARLEELGGSPFTVSSVDFRRLIADESERWGKVIRAANIQ
jgi:tripartite-type tricarboxylate transporter receptor subunit TctC